MIPKKTREELASKPQICARLGEDCDGKITWEHALIYAGRKVQDAFAIIFLCEYHHGVNKHQDEAGLNKRENIRIALSQATPQDLARYPKNTWRNQC